MIKRFGFITLLALMLVFGSVSHADNIGYLNMQQILGSYKEAIKMQEGFQKKIEKYQKTVEKKQKKLEKAKKKKKEKDYKKMEEETLAELSKEQEILYREKQMLELQVLDRITTTAKVVAKEYNIDVIVDKQVVYVGGLNLTPFVLDRLNK